MVVATKAAPSAQPVDENLAAFLAEKEHRDRLGLVAAPMIEPAPPVMVPPVPVSVMESAYSPRQQQLPHPHSYQRQSDASIGGSTAGSSVGLREPPRLISVNGPPATRGDREVDGETLASTEGTAAVDRRYDNGFNSVAVSYTEPPVMSEEYLQHLRLQAAVMGTNNGGGPFQSHMSAPSAVTAGLPMMPPPPFFALHRPANFSDASMHVQVSDVVLQSMGEIRSIADAPLQEYLSSGNGNALSGRIGELIAFKHLQEKLQERLTSIHWMNQNVELGFPYDIEITLDDGRKKRCEVKTRLAVAGQPVNQWHISPHEVKCMQEDPENYFALLFCLEIAPDLSRVCVHSCLEVGLEEGLWSVMESGRGGFIIQMNSW